MNLEDTLLQGTRASQPAASAVAEGSLYFVTDEDIIEQSLASAWTPYSGPAASGSAITALTGDVTATGPGSVAATIANDAVTYAKMQNVSAASKLLGRGSAGGSGNVEEITISTGLTLTGTTLTASVAAAIDQLTGDVTAGPGSGSQAATIANDAVTTVKILDANVTYAKIQDVTAASRLLGRGSAGGSGDVQELTVGSGLAITGTVLDTAGSSGITQLTGDVTAGPGSGSQGATIANNAVTTAKILDANVTLAKIVDASAASILLGRGSSGGSGDFQEITLGASLSMAGTVLSATGGGTAALSGSNVGAIASENLSTAGTIDWLCPNGNVAVPRSINLPTVKKTGTGDILESFFFFGGSGSVFTNSSGVTLTSTGSDSSGGAISVGSFVGKIGSTGSGYRFKVRTRTTQQRLRILTIAFSCTYTLTATMSDGAASPVTITVNTGAATGGGRIIEFLFTGASDYAWLNVIVEETVDLGSSPNVSLAAITLGT